MFPATFFYYHSTMMVLTICSARKLLIAKLSRGFRWKFATSLCKRTWSKLLVSLPSQIHSEEARTADSLLI